MPPTTRATGTSTSAMPITTSTPVNSAPTATPPIPLPQRQSSTAPCFDSKAPSTLCTYLSDYESLAEAAQLTPGERLSQSTQKIFRNLRPHLQIGLRSRKLFSGSTPKPGSPSYPRPIWESSLMKSLGRKFILWTILPPFTGSLGDWQIDWLRKRGSVLMDSTGHTRKASTLSYRTKFCFISRTKRLPVSKARLLKSNMSGKGPNISWKDLTIDTSILDPRLPRTHPHLPRRPHL